MGEVEEARFLEETQAIMVELRLNNPKHLDQVEQSMRNRFVEKHGSESSFVPIVDGVDFTISKMSKSDKSAEDIENRQGKIKGGFLTPKKRILSQEPKLAA